MTSLMRRLHNVSARALGLAESEQQLAETAAAYWNPEAPPDGHLKHYAHWQGVGTFADNERWLALGRAHFGMFERACREAQLPSPAGAVVEWGCGGGMNAIHFVKHAQRYYGVEIGQASLDESARVLGEAGYDGFRPALIAANAPEQALELIDEPCDFFLSTYTFQVFPSKAYGRRVTGIAHRLLKPGGAAVIQIRYDDGSVDGAPKARNYSANVVHFTSYAISEFWLLAESAGFRPLDVYLVPAYKRYPYTDTALAYFLLRKE